MYKFCCIKKGKRNIINVALSIFSVIDFELWLTLLFTL